MDFLAIDWDNSLAAPTRAGDLWQGNSMFSNQFQGISHTPVARWKENLAPIEADIVTLMTRTYLESWNYEAASDTRDTGIQNRAAHWRVATWPIRRRFARVRQKNSSTNNP